MRRLPLLLSLALACALPGAAVPAAGAAPAPLSRMRHLVIITLENHSFDNLYGEFPGADGFAFAKRLRPQVDERGVPYATLPVTPESRLPPGLPNRPFCIEDHVPLDQRPVDISHALDDELRQIHGGRMDRFVQINTQKALALGYYHTSHLPLARLAAEYTLCDRFFHAAIGGSMLSHVWMIAARTARWPDAPDVARTRHDAHGNPTRGGYVTEDGYVIGTCQARSGPHSPRIADSLLVPAQDFDTIGDRLSEKGISWAWYAGGWDDVLAGQPPATFQYHHQPFVFFRRYGPGTAGREHLRDETEFVTAAREGRLPAVAFVKPVGENNQHPGYADVLTGERHTVELIEAVMRGPQWDSTAIVVTYDEHGGFWDHVPPPVVDRWGPGLRVPAIVIAPFAKRHHVDHTTYDTTSLLALIEKRWDLAPLTKRDARAKPLLGAFDFSPRRAAGGTARR
jgi:phospholipase C